MSQNVGEISFKCSRIVLEDDDNLFGEIIYRNLDINITDINGDALLNKSYAPGTVINNSKGIPSLIFLGCSLLKDDCCQIFSRGFYVSLLSC